MSTQWHLNCNSQLPRALVTVLLVVGSALPIDMARSQTASDVNNNIPPNTTGPRDFEGIWWPAPGAGPGGPGGPPPQGGVGGPNAGPPGAGAPPNSGPPTTVAGSMLQCSPIRRIAGGGGGMTTMIIQAPNQIVLISEEQMDIARKIYMNAKHPAHVTPQPNGHSIGHWDGNTLIVDTIGYADKEGKDSGEHVVERISKQGNTLHDEVTITDRSGASRKQNVTWQWRPDFQFNENVCEEAFDRYQIINGVLDNPNIPPSRDKGH